MIWLSYVGVFMNEHPTFPHPCLRRAHRGRRIHQVPGGPVPVTMQNLFVVMSGMLLGPRAGATSQAVYLLMGLMGLPVFSGGGGPGYVMSPTFGYLLGFIAASAVSGLS